MASCLIRGKLVPEPLIVTMGDPTGVGPEIILKALLSGALDHLSRPLLVAGDPGVLQRAAAVFGASGALAAGSGMATHRLTVDGRELLLHALSSLDHPPYGRPDAACGSGHGPLHRVGLRPLPGRGGGGDGHGADQQGGHPCRRLRFPRPYGTAGRPLRRAARW